MGEKSWRAEMPVVVRREASSAPELCFPSDVRELVTRANAELDAKDARIAELERERDAALARAEKSETELADAHTMLKELADRKRYDPLIRTLATEQFRSRQSSFAENILSAPWLKKEGE